MKKKSSLLLNNLTNTNNISYNEKIAYLINNTDNSIVPQIKKVAHMKATSVANNKTNSSNRLTPTNKKEAIIELLKKTEQWVQITERVQKWIDTIKPNIVLPN